MQGAKFSVVLIAIPILALSPQLSADIVHLKAGGKLSGTILNPNQKPRTKYVVRTSKGAKITIDAAKVDRVQRKSKAEEEYESILRSPKMADTAKHHWVLAEFCRKNRLHKQRTFHLEQVVKHDPDHEKARLALGFTKFDGKWSTREERQKAAGLVLYAGTWKTPQEVEILKGYREFELAQKNWNKKVKQLLLPLTKRPNRRTDLALQEIRDIRDPLAAPALGDALLNIKDVGVKRLLLEILSRIEGGAATGQLMLIGLEESNREIRLDAIDYLIDRADENVVATCITKLGSKDNKTINRAAIVLGRIKDREAILPLINALTTKHRTVVDTGPSTKASFDNSGGVGFGAGGGGPKVIERTIENPAVRDALVSITGANHQYSKLAWVNWYVAVSTPRDVSLRRDL